MAGMAGWHFRIFQNVTSIVPAHEVGTSEEMSVSGFGGLRVFRDLSCVDRLGELVSLVSRGRNEASGCCELVGSPTKFDHQIRPPNLITKLTKFRRCEIKTLISRAQGPIFTKIPFHTMSRAFYCHSLFANEKRKQCPTYEDGHHLLQGKHVQSSADHYSMSILVVIMPYFQCYVNINRTLYVVCNLPDDD